MEQAITQVTWQVITSPTTLHSIFTALSSLYTDRASGAASDTRTEESRRMATAEAFYRAGHILPRTVEIPSTAFNATAPFTSVFTTAAILGVSLAAKTVDELRMIGRNLDSIGHELKTQTNAMVQGWQNDGYDAFIYKFIKTEIDDYGGDASVGSHAFYVYNPTTSSDVVFKQMVRAQPLPASFGGFSSDIEAIFRLMWANRQTLRNTMPKGTADDIIFHLLVPAKNTIAIIDRMAIDEGIGRLIIKGHIDDGACYAWFNFVQMPRKVTLHGVGNLDTDTAERVSARKSADQTAKNCIAYWLGAAAGGILFPPVGAAFAAAFAGSIVKEIGCGIYNDISQSTRLSPRLLGPPRTPTQAWDGEVGTFG